MLTTFTYTQKLDGDFDAHEHILISEDEKLSFEKIRDAFEKYAQDTYGETWVKDDHHTIDQYKFSKKTKAFVLVHDGGCMYGEMTNEFGDTRSKFEAILEKAGLSYEHGERWYTMVWKE